MESNQKRQVCQVPEQSKDTAICRLNNMETMEIVSDPGNICVNCIRTQFSIFKISRNS